MLTRYSTTLYTVIGVHFVTAEDFQKVQSKLVLKVLTRQSIQRDQIFKAFLKVSLLQQKKVTF